VFEDDVKDFKLKIARSDSEKKIRPKVEQFYNPYATKIINRQKYIPVASDYLKYNESQNDSVWSDLTQIITRSKKSTFRHFIERIKLAQVDNEATARHIYTMDHSLESELKSTKQNQQNQFRIVKKTAKNPVQKSKWNRLSSAEKREIHNFRLTKITLDRIQRGLEPSRSVEKLLPVTKPTKFKLERAHSAEVIRRSRNPQPKFLTSSFESTTFSTAASRL
jgi:hypothetical protein